MFNLRNSVYNTNMYHNEFGQYSIYKEKYVLKKLRKIIGS